MGAVGIRFDYGLLLPHERVLVSAVANLAAVALDNLETQTSGSGEKRA